MMPESGVNDLGFGDGMKLSTKGRYAMVALADIAHAARGRARQPG
jgi:hypothetical protein